MKFENCPMSFLNFYSLMVMSWIILIKTRGKITSAVSIIDNKVLK